MQPTQPPPVPDPSASDPVVELIRTQRQMVGYVLTALALACLIGATVLAIKTSRLSVTPDTTKTEKDKEKDPEDPMKTLSLDASEVSQPNRLDYGLGSFGAALGMIITGAVGAYLLVSPPKPTEREQRAEARVAILAVVGLIGAVLLILGGLYFLRWSDSLIGWLDKGEAKQAKWVLYPLLMVLAGGGLVFAASQPARAEERNNTPIRRLVYGSNLGLTTLLVLVLLVIANAVIGPRVPNKLDTTSTGFYSLNDQTKQLIETLEQPIRAYAILQDGDVLNEDAKRLLRSCEDANPSKFRVTVLSPSLNKSEINKLRGDYPMAELSREGILLVVGEDDGSPERKRHSFVRAEELGENKTGPDGKPLLAFNGEPKLLRELMYLAENKQRPKIYFTQSSGELALSGGGRNADPRRTAGSLRAYLEKNYFDVQPLVFDPLGPAKVPDDAAVVVVADPVATLPANGAEAIREFMSKPRPDGKKGKLVILVGAQAGPDGKALKTGLEPLLGTFGVSLSDRFMYAQPNAQLDRMDDAGGTRLTMARITQESVQARNPVALGFNKVPQLPLLDCREVSVNQGAPGGQAVTVLVSQPGRLTWTEAQQPRNPVRSWEEMNDRAEKIRSGPGSREQKNKQLTELLGPYQLSQSPRDLAVFVSEGDTARVAVFGCGWFVSDDASVRVAGSGNRIDTVWLDLMGSTLDWVRDRPTVSGVTEKPYSTYSLKPGYDIHRMIWLPLLMSLLIVLGMGAAVWVIRRK